MKKLKYLFGPVSILLISSCGGYEALPYGDTLSNNVKWHNSVYDVVASEQTSFDKLFLDLKAADYVALGEKHYTEEIQLAQARIITGVSGGRSFVTAWEFLNTKDEELIAESFEAYRSDEITGEEFLERTQGSSNAVSYLPILEATKANGRIIGTNLTREQKSPVVRGGIEAANPELVPPNFELGDELYFERFEKAMEGHIGPGMSVENFFDAQCLTDDVIAYAMTNAFEAAPMFLVVGSFHADYRDAAVNRLQIRNPGKSVSAIRFIDASDYEESELLPLLNHSSYGDIADYVVFVNEPSN